MMNDDTTADRDLFSINPMMGAVTKIYQNTNCIMDGALAYNPADGDVYFFSRKMRRAVPPPTSTQDFSKFDQGAEVIVPVGGAPRYRNNRTPAQHRVA